MGDSTSATTAIAAPPTRSKEVFAATASQLQSEQSEHSARNRHRIRLLKARVPPWIVSAVLHAVVLILLALWVFPRQSGRSHIITMSVSDSNQQSVPLLRTQSLSFAEPTVPTATIDNELLVNAQTTSVSIPVTAVQADTHAALASSAAGIIQSVMNPELPPLEPLTTTTSVAGRSDEQRNQLAEKYGASPESELAVQSALQWLLAHQQKDGSWSFDLSTDPCNGQCRNPRNNPLGQPTPNTAATGLALLPLLGHGNTHLQGEHHEAVKRALYYLRSQMRDAQSGRELMHGSMYGHGIATLAIAELYAMTQDPDVGEILKELREFIIMAQHPKGGWRYRPGQPGDMTVTGWQLQALKSAQLGGYPIPTLVSARADDFLNSLSCNGGSQFGYLSPKPEPTPSAVGLLLKMYLGSPMGDPAILRGCRYLESMGPSKTNVYFNYCATMTLHHARSPGFDQWNTQLRDYLVNRQERRGHEAGSWHFADHHGDVGGRLYTTAMCAMVLETYYRYLPLWEDKAFPL